MREEGWKGINSGDALLSKKFLKLSHREERNASVLY
jgi:hypothetical protein